MATKKLTRKELLMVIGHCQTMFGEIRGIAANDRDRDRAAHVDGACVAGFDFCLDALSTEPPIECKGKSKWATGPKYGGEV